MAAIIRSLLTLLASLTRQELARQVAYLKAQNRILRSRLPEQISLSNQERRTLIRHGQKLGAPIKELISIVSYATFRRWMRQLAEAPSKRPMNKYGKNGRPRVEEGVSDAIIRIRRETGCGYTKIAQALRRLGHKVSRQTVKNVIVAAGLGPQPNDHPDTWSDFLRRHAATLWQCGFACKKKWTAKGLVDVYFLVFIHLGTRRIWISPCTEHPTGNWTTQQARNFSMHIEKEDVPCRILCRDNDTKYVAAFDEVFKSVGCQKSSDEQHRGLALRLEKHLADLWLGFVPRDHSRYGRNRLRNRMHLSPSPSYPAMTCLLAPLRTPCRYYS